MTLSFAKWNSGDQPKRIDTATPGGRLSRGWPPDRQGSGTARLGGRLGWFSPSWRGQRGGHLLQAVAVGWVSYGRWWGALPVQIWEKKKKTPKIEKKTPRRQAQATTESTSFVLQTENPKDRKFRASNRKPQRLKEQREKREQREEREKFSEEMRGERNFRNKYQLV